MKKSNKKTSKCKLHKCSLIKRSKLAQTGLSNLNKNQLHPTLEGLYFVGLLPDGRERWQTADEIADRAVYQSRYYKSNQSEKSAKIASKRAALKKQNDRQAENLLNRYGRCGMAPSVWVKLPRPIKERLKRMMPDLVWTSEADRVARQGAQMADLRDMMEQSRVDAEVAMKAKMARSKSVHAAMELVTTASAVPNNKKRSPLTQAELNKLSNSRYAMPKCYSDFAQLIEEDNDDDAY